MKSNLPLKSEQTASLTIGSDSTEILTTSDKIVLAHKNELRIKDLGQNNEPIKKALVYIFSLIGLKGEKYPNQSDMINLIHFIKNNLMQYTATDFTIAFEMALKGEIENIDLKHYQSFNALYLTEVMKAYKNHRNAVISEIKRKEMTDEFNNRFNKTEEEKKQIEISFWENCIVEEYKKFCKGEKYFIMPTTAKYIYKELKKRGYINISREQQKEIFDTLQAKYIEIKWGKPLTLQEYLEKNKKETDMYDIIQRQCYLYMIDKTFLELKENKIDLQNPTT